LTGCWKKRLQSWFGNPSSSEINRGMLCAHRVDRAKWQIPRRGPDCCRLWDKLELPPHNKLPVRARDALAGDIFSLGRDVAKINSRVNSPLFPSHAINRRPFRCLRSAAPRTHKNWFIIQLASERTHMCVLPVTFCAGAAISISKHLVRQTARREHHTLTILQVFKWILSLTVHSIPLLGKCLPMPFGNFIVYFCVCFEFSFFLSFFVYVFSLFFLSILCNQNYSVFLKFN
jgi:hypothetical protein